MSRWLKLLVLVTLGGLSVGWLWGGCRESPERAKAEKDRHQKLQTSPPASLTTGEITPPQSPSSTSQLSPPTLSDLGDTNEVAVIVTDLGEIWLEFFPSVAPIHVANFKKLARAGFYDGTTFHRVVPGFVIQGGDPNTKDSDPHNDGMGGPPWSLKAEFSDIPHDKGILSMARAQDPNSAGSQFFICLGRAPHLDGKYTVFGRVIKGWEVVERIGKTKRDPMNPRDRSLPAVVIQRVRVVPKANVKE